MWKFWKLVLVRTPRELDPTCWDLSVVDWGRLWGSSEWMVPNRVDVEELRRCYRVR